jgi:hypothetical protein
MAASVGPDGGHYIGQHLLIDRFLGSPPVPTQGVAA